MKLVFRCDEVLSNIFHETVNGGYVIALNLSQGSSKWMLDAHIFARIFCRMHWPIFQNSQLDKEKIGRY